MLSQEIIEALENYHNNFLKELETEWIRRDNGDKYVFLRKMLFIFKAEGSNALEYQFDFFYDMFLKNFQLGFNGMKYTIETIFHDEQNRGYSLRLKSYHDNNTIEFHRKY